MQPQCGASCSSNYECASLGDNQPPGSEWCGECNLVHGTRGFGTCYNASDDDNDDFVQPWTYPGGVGYTCATQCNNNSDCQEGGFVDCGTCNKEHGTQGYNTCINPPENESTVALEEFALGSATVKGATRCNNDSDCQEGETCNKERGTPGYDTCINPPENESTVALA